MARPVAELTLTSEEAQTLKRWIRRRNTAQTLALRSRIVLSCAGVRTNTAEELKITTQTVGKWRKRFVENRLDGLLDDPRCGAPRTITDEQVETVVVRTLETTPKNATHWSTGRWPRRVACRRRPSRASGVRSGCSRIDGRRSSFLKTHSSWRRSGMLWGCI